MQYLCLRGPKGSRLICTTGTVKRATKDEYHAQHWKPGGEGAFRLLLNSTLVKHFTGVPAALHLTAGFFRGAG